MEILHVNSYYSVGKFYKNLYEAQIENGLDISVYVPVCKSFLDNKFEFGSYTAISRVYSNYERLIFHLKHSKIYKDLLQRYNIASFSLVHAHSLFSNGYIALKLKRYFNIPYVVAVRNTDVNIFFKYVMHMRKTGIDILNEAYRVVFLSKSYRDQVIKTYVPTRLRSGVLNKSVIIPNGIDQFWLDNLSTPKKLNSQKKIKVLYVGAINKNKNITTTIEALDKLISEGYNVEFTVVGKVEDKEVFKSVKSSEFTKYIDYKPKENLLGIYSENDIFVMPSITETFGLVYAEAMSQGLPVIYSSNQGFDGHFQDGMVGYGVDCFDSYDIANKIKDTIKNYNDLSANCITGAQNFRWKYINERYMDIYREIDRENGTCR